MRIHLAAEYNRGAVLEVIFCNLIIHLFTAVLAALLICCKLALSQLSLFLDVPAFLRFRP